MPPSLHFLIIDHFYSYQLTTIVLMSGVPTAVWTNTAMVEQIHRSPVLPLHHGEWSLSSEPPSMLGLCWEQSSDSNKNFYTGEDLVRRMGGGVGWDGEVILITLKSLLPTRTGHPPGNAVVLATISDHLASSTDSSIAR